MSAGVRVCVHTISVEGKHETHMNLTVISYFNRDKFSLMVDGKGNLDTNKLRNVYKCDIEQARKVAMISCLSSLFGLWLIDYF